jgi:hypothetical protein
MITKLCFPTMAAGFDFMPRPLPPIAATENEQHRRTEQYADLDRAVAQTCEHLSRLPERGAAAFGERIKEAVKRRQAHLRRGRAVTASASEEESFGQKIKRAVEKRTSQKGKGE